MALLTLAVELSLDSDHNSHNDPYSKCQDDTYLATRLKIEAASSSQQLYLLLQMQDKPTGAIILAKNTDLL
ncbi:MAG: hypothetical protein EBR82_19250 [Caulobacteraceae bacterium]|nr:hypothetical protein [Caulobacteraceae bacterium]